MSKGNGYGEDYLGGASTVPTRAYMGSSYTEATDPVAAFQGRCHTPAPRIPTEDRVTTFRKPGWSGRPPARAPPRLPYPQKKQGLICYHCYEKSHGAPTCLLLLQEMRRVLRNYEALSPMESLRISLTSYLKVKKWLHRGLQAHRVSLPGVRTELQEGRPRGHRQT